MTLRQLGKKVGDRVRIGIAPYARTVVITGTVTLPSFGVGAADHPSLGHGAMVPEATLLAAMGQATGRPADERVAPRLLLGGGHRPGPGHHRGAAGRPGGPDRLGQPGRDSGRQLRAQHARASAIVNTEQMGGQPLALALGLAVAAVLSLALTVLSLVRRRRRELALLKALGMTRSQVRAVIAWQTTLTLLIAVAVGGALGIAGGRLAWHAFAGSLGVVPIVEVPVAALVLGLAALVLAGNLLASLPAAVAARTRPGVSLRTE